MKTESFLLREQISWNDERRETIRREKTATDFEKIFARYLVDQMAGSSFSETGISGVPQTSSALYREFIVDALSGELAAQKTLGMADMIMRYWEQGDEEGENTNKAFRFNHPDR